MEFIRDKKRFCLWLEGCPPDEIRKMPLVYERVKNVREFSLKSKNAATPTFMTKFQYGSLHADMSELEIQIRLLELYQQLKEDFDFEEE